MKTLFLSLVVAALALPFAACETSHTETVSKNPITGSRTIDETTVHQNDLTGRTTVEESKTKVP